MSIRVVFYDGSVTEYPEGAGVSGSPDGTLLYVNDVAGDVLAVLTQTEVKETVVV